MFVFTSFNSSGISSSNMIMCLNELHVTCPRKKEGVWIRGGVGGGGVGGGRGVWWCSFFIFSK